MKTYLRSSAPVIENDKLMTIITDYREKHSGIPGMLLQKGANVRINNLKTGDYIINNQIVIERKSSEDFIQSLVSGRLFQQCARLRSSASRSLLLIEGDLYHTRHQISKPAVKGALLSVTASWQLAVIYSENPEDSANLIFMLGNQELQQNYILRYNSYKPKKLKNQRLRFLQGLPNIGAVMAFRMYEHFGSILAVVNADVKELQGVEGIGKKSAVKIREFLSGKSFTPPNF